jgi:hypothetical protein
MRINYGLILSNLVAVGVSHDVALPGCPCIPIGDGTCNSSCANGGRYIMHKIKNPPVSTGCNDCDNRPPIVVKPVYTLRQKRMPPTYLGTPTSSRRWGRKRTSQYGTYPSTYGSMYSSSSVLPEHYGSSSMYQQYSSSVMPQHYSYVGADMYGMQQEPQVIGVPVEVHAGPWQRYKYWKTARDYKKGKKSPLSSSCSSGTCSTPCVGPSCPGCPGCVSPQYTIGPSTPTIITMDQQPSTTLVQQQPTVISTLSNILQPQLVSSQV